MALQLFDTHAHLNDNRLKGDITGAIERAASQGVDRIICVGFDIPSSRAAVDLASKYERVWAAVGVHPHDAKTLDDKALAEIETLARKPKVVAIGEIGLDFYRDLSPRPVQEKAFRSQLTLAKELDLPVVIHDREAGSDLLRVIEEEESPPAGGVMHCFSENLEFALRAIELGFYIGIAGPVTFAKSYALRDIVGAIPMDRLLVETDAPYLTPEPYRGRKNNEPAFVRLVAEKVAEVKGMDFGEVARITSANAARLFAITS